MTIFGTQFSLVSHGTVNQCGNSCWKGYLHLLTITRTVAFERGELKRKENPLVWKVGTLKYSREKALRQVTIKNSLVITCDPLVQQHISLIRYTEIDTSKHVERSG